MTRLSISHKRLTHGPLMVRETLSICYRYQVRPSVFHVLLILCPVIKFPFFDKVMSDWKEYTITSKYRK